MKPNALIPPGAVLMSAVIVTATVLPSFEHAISPCFDHRTTAMICTAVVPEMAEGPEGDEPEPLQAQRAVAAIASSTVSQFRTVVVPATITLSSAA
jgi:hypothetical protein